MKDIEKVHNYTPTASPSPNKRKASWETTAAVETTDQCPSTSKMTVALAPDSSMTDAKNLQSCACTASMSIKKAKSALDVPPLDIMVTKTTKQADTKDGGGENPNLRLPVVQSNEGRTVVRDDDESDRGLAHLGAAHLRASHSAAALARLGATHRGISDEDKDSRIHGDPVSQAAFDLSSFSQVDSHTGPEGHRPLLPAGFGQAPSETKVLQIMHYPGTENIHRLEKDGLHWRADYGKEKSPHVGEHCLRHPFSAFTHLCRLLGWDEDRILQLHARLKQHFVTADICPFPDDNKSGAAFFHDNEEMQQSCAVFLRDFLMKLHSIQVIVVFGRPANDFVKDRIIPALKQLKLLEDPPTTAQVDIVLQALQRGKSPSGTYYPHPSYYGYRGGIPHQDKLDFIPLLKAMMEAAGGETSFLDKGASIIQATMDHETKMKDLWKTVVEAKVLSGEKLTKEEEEAKSFFTCDHCGPGVGHHRKGNKGCKLYKLPKRCEVAECDRPGQSGGESPGCCVDHGGGVRCLEEECDYLALFYGNGKRGYCSTHGGGYRCIKTGCDRPGQSGGESPGCCVDHGGGVRCLEEECDYLALFYGNGKRGYCSTHGGGYRCIKTGCDKPGHSGGENPGCCLDHGGGVRCLDVECQSLALFYGNGKRGCCKTHGGGYRCIKPGCDKPTNGPNQCCSTHGGGVHCKMFGCGKPAVKDFLCQDCCTKLEQTYAPRGIEITKDGKFHCTTCSLDLHARSITTHATLALHEILSGLKHSKPTLHKNLLAMRDNNDPRYTKIVLDMVAAYEKQKSSNNKK